MRERDPTAVTLLAEGRVARWRRIARYWLPGLVGASPALLAALACARDGSVLGALALAKLGCTLAISIVYPPFLRPPVLFGVDEDPTALRPTALRPRWRGRPLGSLPFGPGRRLRRRRARPAWARIWPLLGRCSERDGRPCPRRPEPRR